MKVTITTSFPLRGENISSSYSFPVYSEKIEETMIRELEFLKNYETFSLVMKVEKSS
jgi:hypothetical protein